MRTDLGLGQELAASFHFGFSSLVLLNRAEVRHNVAVILRDGRVLWTLVLIVGLHQSVRGGGGAACHINNCQ